MPELQSQYKIIEEDVVLVVSISRNLTLSGI
jgi:hypothetical protein